MQGVIASRNDRRQFLIIQSEAGDIFGHFNDCQKPAGHVCMHQIGVPVRFDIAVQDGQQRAINITLDCPVELDEYEMSTIYRWLRTFGFVRRNGCQCELFLSGVQLGLYDGVLGMQVRHRVEPRQCNRGEGFAAVDVQVLQP